MTISEISTLENRENGPLHGQYMVLTGGTGGTGLSLARSLFNLGADIGLVGRNFEAANEVFKGLPIDRYSADLSRAEDIVSLTERLKLKQPHGLILGAADGLSTVFDDSFASVMGEFRRQAKNDASAALAYLENNFEERVIRGYDTAYRVNFAGPQYMVGRLIPHFAPGAKIMYMSSLPSTFARVIRPPAFYRGVAETKKRMEEFLLKNEHLFLKNDIQVSIVSGHLLPDTKSGKGLLTLARMIRKMAPSLNMVVPDESEFPTTEDMVRKMAELSIQRKPYPAVQTHYVLGQGYSTDHPEEALEVYQRIKIPLT